MSEIKCPQCGTLVEYIPGEADFCSECGSLLKSPETSVEKEFSPGEMTDLLSKVADSYRENPDPPEETQHLRILEKVDRLIESLDGDSSGKVDQMLHRSVAPEGNGNPASNSVTHPYVKLVEPEGSFTFAKDDNPYLQAAYNVNIFFIKGSQSVIRLQLTPRSDQLKGAVVFMETMDGTERVRREYLVTEELRGGVPVEARLPYRPVQVSGRTVFTYCIGCVLETETKYYQFSVEHTIYSPDQSTQSASQIIIKDVKAFGSDFNLGPVRDILSDKAPTMHDLIERLNNLPPQFICQNLRETTWRPESGVVRGSRYPGNLVLEWNKKRLLLLAGKPLISIGRLSENDLVVRAKGRNGPLRLDEYPNNTVSRIHAELHYKGDSVQIIDKSKWGTYINDYNLDRGDVLVPDSSDVEFGDIFMHMELQTCQMRQDHVICQTCVANPVRSLILTRRDQAETYLIVWQCCELGRIIPELADWVVFYRGNAFLIRTPDQNFTYLRPGSAFNVNRQEIRVDYFRYFWAM